MDFPKKCEQIHIESLESKCSSSWTINEKPLLLLTVEYHLTVEYPSTINTFNQKSKKEDLALQPGGLNTGHCVGLAKGWGQEGVQCLKLPHFYKWAKAPIAAGLKPFCKPGLCFQGSQASRFNFRP